MQEPPPQLASQKRHHHIHFLLRLTYGLREPTHHGQQITVSVQKQAIVSTHCRYIDIYRNSLKNLKVQRQNLDQAIMHGHGLLLSVITAESF